MVHLGNLTFLSLIETQLLFFRKLRGDIFLCLNKNLTKYDEV